MSQYQPLTGKFESPEGEAAVELGAFKARPSARAAQLEVKERAPASGGRLCCTVAERLVVVPEEAHWLAGWDMWVVTLLCVTAYYEPYAVAVMSEDPSWALALNEFLDLTFTVDMLLTFFIAHGDSHESAMDKPLWEKDLGRIARRYCNVPLSSGGVAGWFWIDLVTVLPGWLEILLPAGSLGSSKSLVLLRLLRLVRLTKLVRLQHLLMKWHQRYGFPFFVVDLGKFLFTTTLAIHWMACLWIIVEGRVLKGKLSYRTQQESWLSALIKAKGDSCTPRAEEDPNCVYVIALYWATMTLTTVGYGDITAQNPVEYLVCSICMFVMAYVWAYVVGKMVTLLESLDPEWQNFKQSMDTVQSLMQSRGLPDDLQVRLRRYMHSARLTSVQRVQQTQLQEHVSQSLQREVASCGGIIDILARRICWARDLQRDVLLDLVRALEPCSFGPAEIVNLPQTLVLVRRGIAAVRGRILNRGDIWGELDILLVTESLVEAIFPRTLSYMDLLALSRSSLLRVCQAFPNADRRLRKAQIRTAVFRSFIKTARDRAAHLADEPANKRRVTTMLFQGAATSLVKPGQSKLHMSGFSCQDEPTLSDLKLMLERLFNKHDALEARVNSALARIRPP